MADKISLKSERIELPVKIKGHCATDIIYINRNNNVVVDHNIKIIIVPGNPGIVDFYREFIKIIYREFEGRIDIIGVSHLGHCGQIDQQFTVEDQIKHKQIFLDYLLSQNLEDGLSPFIRFAIKNRVRNVVSNFLHYIPSFLSNSILSVILPSDEMKIAVAQKINYYSAINILYMAHTETLDIRQIDDEYEMLESYPNGDIEYSNKYVPHAFVLSHSEEIAIRVSAWLFDNYTWSSSSSS
eukprot:gene1366-1724_t